MKRDYREYSNGKPIQPTIDYTETIEGEEWKPVKDWEEDYMISSLGRIKSVDRYRKGRGGTTQLLKGRILKYSMDKYGYHKIGLYYCSHSEHYTIHRLVAQAFIPNPLHLPQINHISGIKTDNRIENLEWCTNKHNMQHAVRTGLKQTLNQRGEKCNFSKATEDIVRKLRNEYNKKTMNYGKLSDKYGLSQGAISMIVRRLTWKHVI